MTHTYSTDHAPALLSVRLITDDVPGLVSFYEQVLGAPAQWATPDFAELRTAVGTLAVASTRTVALFGAGSARPADNHTAIIELLVQDVDAEHARLQAARDIVGGTAVDFVNEPTTMPWGNRSLLFRDPDGNLVNVFTPVSPEAIARSRG